MKHFQGRSPLPPRPWTLVAALVAFSVSGYAAWRLGRSLELALASRRFESRPQHATRRVLVVGDSTAVGTGASAARHSVPGLLALDHPRVAVVNRAVAGAKFEDVARQLVASHESFDLVLVMAGANDVLRLTGRERLRRAVARVAVLARERAGQVVFLPCGNVGNAPFFFPPLSWVMAERARTLHELLRATASRHGASYVDLYRPRESDPFALAPRRMHAADGLHPADDGYRLWYRELQAQAGQAMQALVG
jgi:lysophospholipase L1-like esterase